METQDRGKNDLAWAIISTVLIIFIVTLDIFDRSAGIIILVSYFALALLFISGHYKLLMAILALTVTVLGGMLLIAGDSIGIFKGPTPVVIFILWLIIMAFTLEYIFVSGEQGLEKLPLYRQYLVLNMSQCLTLLFSTVILSLGPHLAGDSPVPRDITLNACTLLVIFFFISFGLFVSFIFRTMFSAAFMGDFAKALYDIGRDTEYEDRKQGIKTAGADYDFGKTLRRMRFITYILFAASLAGLFFISKTRVLDAYAHAVSGRNPVIDMVIYTINNPPRALVSLMKMVFFVVDILIIRDLIKIFGGDRLRQWLAKLNELPRN